MKFNYILTALGILSGAALGTAYAQGAAEAPYTTTAVPFLRIAPDARAAALGGAGIATSADANAVFWNGAKIPFAKSPTAVAATYTPWLREINGEMFLASVAGYHRLGEGQALTASVRYFNMGSFEQADYSGTVQQTNQPRDYAIDLGYSRALSGRLGVGVALRYIHSRLVSGALNGTSYNAGSAVAADLSVFYNGADAKGAGWSWGAALSNLGSRVRYSNNAAHEDYLPAKLGLGGAYTAVFNEDNKLALTADLNKLLVPSVATDSTGVEHHYSKGVMSSWVKSFDDYNRLQFSAGAEYTFKEQFVVRAGYYAETKYEGDRQYFTAGAGINYAGFGVNFSYLAPFNDAQGQSPLSNTLRFGVVYNLAP